MQNDPTIVMKMHENLHAAQQCSMQIFMLLHRICHLLWNSLLATQKKHGLASLPALFLVDFE